MELSKPDDLTQTNEIASKTQREKERDGAKPDGHEIAIKTKRQQERDGAKPDAMRQLSRPRDSKREMELSLIA